MYKSEEGAMEEGSYGYCYFLLGRKVRVKEGEEGRGEERKDRNKKGRKE